MCIRDRSSGDFLPALIRACHEERKRVLEKPHEGFQILNSQFTKLHTTFYAGLLFIFIGHGRWVGTVQK